ncbi:PIN domain-containing protein [Algoriphagus sp.]|uniref:PIN domain-containing protein n=2 Tax=Algoriphagus sp. TaxID=1872435 RepID=UPI002731D43B|nr:PIN domain-containing protein [Algoriphagus sp.]
MRVKSPILVDSSVWIEFLKSPKPSTLDKFIDEDLVSTNDIILSELIPRLQLERKADVIDSLISFEKIPLIIDWDLIRHYQILNLKNGVNKVGIPDLIILQQVIEEKLTLFSYDKHFKLMQGFLKFELIT